jgi:8-oxo-dGTP pyrophosphatase MutT (NUDIX family)
MVTGVRGRLQALLFGAYRRLPPAGRLLVIRSFTPSFHVGALCVIEREDGALLLLRQSYRRKEAWGFPGGLLKRGEQPADAVRREVKEELGIDVDVDDAPMVVVEPRYRRVDVVYKGRLSQVEDTDRAPPADTADAVAAAAAAADQRAPTPSSPEILEVRWFPPGQLPILLPEATTALLELARANRPAVEDDDGGTRSRRLDGTGA